MMMFSWLLIVAFAILAVWLRNLLHAVICLGGASAALALAMYRMGFPFAAAFELSVAAGLITVLFVSAISLVKSAEDRAREAGMAGSPSARPLGEDEREPARLRWLPLVLVVLIPVCWVMQARLPRPSGPSLAPLSLGEALWQLRALDVVAMAMLLLCGGLVVILFFREKRQ